MLLIDNRLMQQCRPLERAKNNSEGLPEQISEVMRVTSINMQRYVECRELHSGLIKAVETIQDNQE